ncbi:MAG: DUF1610 domain-containing protein [Euryarchaeota archaeon]|nr:DUF1610 domain-containing protein [Euryarchaeota archaeon]
MERCTSCGARLSEKGYARFPCPMCGARLGRCWRCRKQSIDYRCACGFTGP